jgi:hypothetical protein
VGLHHEYRWRPDSPWVFGFAVGTSAAARNEDPVEHRASWLRVVGVH